MKALWIYGKGVVMRKSVKKNFRALSAVIVAMGMACGISGCKKTEVLQPVTTNAEEAIVTPEQYERIAQTTIDELEAADGALDASQLAQRLMDPILAQRTAQYKLKSLKDDVEIGSIVIDPKATPLSSGTEFPRGLLSYSPPVEGQNQRTLTAWQQDSARSNYKLWGQVVLFPSADLPKITSALSSSQGYSQKDSGSYLADPSGVTAAYAQYLQTQELGEVKFKEGDELFSGLKSQLDSLKETIGDFGEVSLSVADSGVAPIVVNTSDGGAVVFGEIKYHTTYKTKNANRPIVLKETAEALMHSGDKEKTSVEIAENSPLTASYSVVVAFYVPPTAGENVQVIGASSNVLYSATVE